MRISKAVREALDACEKALDGMDRAGGDRDGMPECPWCRCGPDGEDHTSDCELMIAREALRRLARGSRSPEGTEGER